MVPSRSGIFGWQSSESSSDSRPCHTAQSATCRWHSLSLLPLGVSIARRCELPDLLRPAHESHQPVVPTHREPVSRPVPMEGGFRPPARQCPICGWRPLWREPPARRGRTAATGRMCDGEGAADVRERGVREVRVVEGTDLGWKLRDCGRSCEFRYRAARVARYRDQGAVPDLVAVLVKACVGVRQTDQSSHAMRWRVQTSCSVIPLSAA
jgi:hypothetical protein